MKRYYVFFAVLVIAVAVVIVANHKVMAGPAADNRTETDLENISSAVQIYAENHNRLPAGLSQLDLSSDTAGRIGDYDYKTTGRALFQLCATFKAASRQSGNYAVQYPDPRQHQAGYQCFNYDESAYFEPSPAPTVIITPQEMPPVPVTTPTPKGHPVRPLTN